MGIELLAPLGVLALAALPIVVLLHMRHTTPQPRPVPTLRFWTLAQEAPTERSKLRRPPLTVLLLLQLLVAGALGFALTRPATADAWSSLGLRTEPKHVIILLDGSTSMGAIDTSDGQARFDAARDLALDRVADLQEGDVATVVLLGTRVTTFEATAAAEFPAFRARLAGLRLPGGRADLDAALGLTRDLLLPKLADEVVLITDGALTVDPGLVADLGAPIELVVVGGEPVGPIGGNVAITDLSARAMPGSPDQQQLWLRIANFTPQSVAVPVVVWSDGIESARRTVELPPNGQFVELAWDDLPVGTSEVSVALEVQDAFPADDRASLILRQESDLTLRILLVTDVPGPLARALSVLPGAELKIEATDSPTLQNIGSAYDLVVYENTAPPSTPLPDAALLFVRPTPDGQFFPTRGTMSTPTVVRALPQNPLLTGVDLSGLTFGETPVYDSLKPPDWTEVVEGDAGPLIARGSLQGRPSVVLAFDIASSNISRRIAFPILIANIAAQLVPSPLPPSVPLGDPLVYRPSADAVGVRITAPGDQSVELQLPELPPEAAGYAQGAGGADLREVSFTDTGRAGEYQLVELAADGTQLGGGRFVVNAGHAAESDLRPNLELPEVLATSHSADQAVIGSDLFELWPLFAAAALALLTLEWLLALAPWRRPAVAVATTGVGSGGRGRR
jgi:hypothetical protein